MGIGIKITYEEKTQDILSHAIPIYIEIIED